MAAEPLPEMRCTHVCGCQVEQSHGQGPATWKPLTNHVAEGHLCGLVGQVDVGKYCHVVEEHGHGLMGQAS